MRLRGFLKRKRSSIVEVEWEVHRTIIVRAGAIHRIDANEDGRRQQRLKGRSELLPVGRAFRYRFKSM
jgi:DNA-binding LytR/AlgR family response regulator